MRGPKKNMRTSWMLFALLALVSASLCYSYLSSIAVPVGGLGDVNIALFAIPVALAILLLGAPWGIVLAFVTGMLVMLRAQWTAVTFFDFRLCDPFLSVPSLVVAATLMAVVFAVARRRHPLGPPWGKSPLASIGRPRLIYVACGCLAFALAFSFVSRGVMYLFVTPGGAEYGYAATIERYLASMRGPWPFVEAVLNAIVLFCCCVVALAVRVRMVSHAYRLSLAATFNRWLALALAVVFLLATSVSFCAETLRATAKADAEVVTELDYLMDQIDDHGADRVMSIVRKYRSAFGGTVYVVRGYEVIASNDPDEIGADAREILSSANVDNYQFLLDQIANQMLMGHDAETGRFLGMRALVGDSYTLFMEAPLDSVFQARLSTLRYTAIFLLLIFVAVYFVVDMLLRRIVVEPISRTNETLSRITAGELNQRVNERAVTEFDALSNGVNTTVAALKDTIDEVAQRNVQDLATAKKIQESALPREFPPFPDLDRFDLFASMKPAKEVGGDFYDFFRIGECGLVFLVADVSGKGISAALFMMTAKTQIKNNIMAGMPIEAAVTAANHQLCLGNEAGMFVTLFCCLLDFETGELTYVNAGHNPPVLRHRDKLSWLRKKSGLPLGLFDGIKYKRFERKLDEGDLMFLYTDGVNEAFSADGQLFGDDAILEQLDRSRGMNARSTCAGMRLALSEFTVGAEQSDDITMLALIYGVPPEPRATMELSAEVDQLVHVQHLIYEELHRCDAPSSVSFALDVAVEELFVNICTHAYPDATHGDPGEVRVECEFDAGIRALHVTLSDEGIPFDPLAHIGAVEGDPTAGLGIRLAARSVDKISYTLRDGRNICTITKGW